LTRLDRWYPRLHRWLGISTLLFILILSVTGIALNHSVEIGLDRRFVAVEWLLRWYGIDAPAPSASFSPDGHTVALIGERLYFDENELADGVQGLVGAVALSGRIVIATPTRIFLIGTDGVLVEQLPVSGFLPADVTAVGRTASAVVFLAGDEPYASGADLLAAMPLTATGSATVDWAERATLEPEQREALRRLYRGRGLTLERVLLDIHSGRIVTRAGRWFMDGVAIALIALSLFSLVLWLRRRRRRS